MNLVQRDEQVIWHPFTQKELADLPVPIIHASGVWLYTPEGNRILDATSSWWVNAHGHTHPHIVSAIARQAEKLEHIIFAGFTHEPAVQLAERLIQLMPGAQSKIFYSDNGSTSVEVALKIAIQYFHNLNIPRKRIIAFRQAYHGDTVGGMSVAERNAFNQPFKDYLFEPEFIDVPEYGNEAAALQNLKEVLAKKDAAAFIFEPLVQGVAGMRMQNADTLSAMIDLCRQEGVVTIADEVFTGFYRTGRMFASSFLAHKPDIICLSKALTGGFLPLGVTAVPEFISDAFRSTNKYKTFFHGHSFTANPLACAAANASLDLFEAEDFQKRIALISGRFANFRQQFEGHRAVIEIRQMGCILAIELKSKQMSGYMNDMAAEISRWFLKRNIYIRPLGNILYLTPPYCIAEDELELLLRNVAEYLEV